MSLYSVSHFFHIVVELLMFVLLTIEGVALRQGFIAARLNRMLGPISALTILVPGLYMSASQWGWKGWIVVGIAAWVLIAVAGAATGITLLAGPLEARDPPGAWSVWGGNAPPLRVLQTRQPPPPPATTPPPVPPRLLCPPRS